jgi:hypothetical protein
VGVPLDLAVLGEEPKMVASMVSTQTAILTTSHLLIFPLPVRTNPFCALKFALHCIKMIFCASTFWMPVVGFVTN